MKFAVLQSYNFQQSAKYEGSVSADLISLIFTTMNAGADCERNLSPKPWRKLSELRFELSPVRVFAGLGVFCVLLCIGSNIWRGYINVVCTRSAGEEKIEGGKLIMSWQRCIWRVKVIGRYFYVRKRALNNKK